MVSSSHKTIVLLEKLVVILADIQDIAMLLFYNFEGKLIGMLPHQVFFSINS
jgi:hypothetical protein